MKKWNCKKWGDKNKSVKVILMYFLVCSVPFLQYLKNIMREKRRETCCILQMITQKEPARRYWMHL